LLVAGLWSIVFEDIYNTLVLNTLHNKQSTANFLVFLYSLCPLCLCATIPTKPILSRTKALRTRRKKTFSTCQFKIFFSASFAPLRDKPGSIIRSATLLQNFHAGVLLAL